MSQRVVCSTALEAFCWVVHLTFPGYVFSLCFLNKHTRSFHFMHVSEMYKKKKKNKCQENCLLSSLLLKFHCGSFDLLYLLILNLTYFCVIWMSKDKRWDLSEIGWEDTLTGCQAEKILLTKLLKICCSETGRRKNVSDIKAKKPYAASKTKRPT